MRKTFVAVILLTFFLPLAGSADIIQPGYHTLQREVVITNISSYPDIAIIAYQTGPMIQTYAAQQVQENAALNVSYKFNALNILAVKQAYINAAGGINNIDFSTMTQKLNLDFLGPCIATVPDSIPVIYEKITYELRSETSTTLTLHVTQRLLRFNDGSPDRTETY